MNHRAGLRARTLAVFAGCLTIIASSAVAAQETPVTPDLNAELQDVTRGLTIPFASIADREDAQSLELNPAGLAHLQGWELIVTQSYLQDNRNDGVGLMLAAPLVDGLAVGYGHQILDQGLGGERYTKHTLGLGFGGPVALGFNYNFYGSETYRALDELSSWDVGVQFRPWSWLALAANVRDANTPFYDDTHTVRPSLDAGLALRFLDGRILFETNTTFKDGTQQVQPRFLGLIEPFDGIRLFGQVVTDTGPDGGDFEFSEASAGLEINFDHFGTSAAAVVADGAGGYTAAARVSELSWRSPASDPKRFHRLKLAGDFSERAGADLFGRTVGTSFLELMQGLETMVADPSVEGLILDLDEISMGYGQLWELRQMLERFKAREVKMVAYLRASGYREYYLATVADAIYMGPSATFNARGVLAQQDFYRAALDKLGVEPDFIKIAEYKTAPESFMREAPSEENEETLNAFMDVIYEEQVSAMATSRKLTVDALKALVNDAPHSPKEARDAGLIDEVIYEDELEDKLEARYGAKVAIKKGYGKRERDYAWGKNPTIAVIYIDGAIVTGESGANPLLGGTLSGSDTIERTATWAKDNDNVAAVVLRVDSPGGSAVASDIIYRALRQLGDKKPVIVSMGNIAASGGYYVAAAGETIVCAPTTLTGSIGIYSGKFALNKLFASLGFNRVSYERGANANLYSIDKPWTEGERKEILEQITYLYGLFLEQVAAGRKMSTSEVDKVGRGHIWSGRDAVKVKLCDQHGGILDAIALAKRRAGLQDDEEINVTSVPQTSLFAPFSPGIGVHIGALDLTQLIGSDVPTVRADASQAELWQAYGPLRALLEPMRPALDLALLFRDGEAVSMLPFVLKWK